MLRKPRYKLVDEFVKVSSKCGEIRLVAGIDTKPPKPYPNAIFYIRMESRDRKSGESCETENIWLSLNEMTRLGVLMNVASRFWVETFRKEEFQSKEKIDDFVKEYKEIREALKRLLPEE